MGNYNRDDLDAKALMRLLTEEQLSALAELVGRSGALLFDSVAGSGCWQAEFDDEQRRILCQRIMVRMVGELFRPPQPLNSRNSTLH